MDRTIFVDNDKDSFIKMFPELIGTIFTLVDRKHLVSIKVLMFLVRNMNSRNQVHVVDGLICSQPVIAELLNTTQCSVSHAITELKKMNAINTSKTGPTLVYTVNSNLVWQNRKDTEAEYSKFCVNVILSSKEQTETRAQRKKHGKSNIVKSIQEEE